MTKPNPPALATARAQVYIDTVIGGRKTVYDVPTAIELYEQLGLALKSINAGSKKPGEDPKMIGADDETDPESQSPTPDDQDQQEPDAPRLAAVADSPPDA